MRESTIYHPRMISVSGNSYCELARWALDFWGIVYDEECHAPMCHALATRRYATHAVVMVDTGEAVLLDAGAVVDYYDARAPIDHRLWPTDLAARAETKRWFDFFLNEFGLAAERWVEAQMLGLRGAMVRVWTKRVPLWERLTVKVFYPLLAATVRKNPEVTTNTVAAQLSVIEAALDQVESRLADGRRFLLGERLAAADLALASMAAPILLPQEYGGPQPTLSELPSEMRVAVERWRARPAGQFILRLYKEGRPGRSPDLVALGKHASGRTFRDMLANFLVRPAILRPLFAMLRSLCPVCVLGKHAIITRFDDVIEVLKRDCDFTIAEINAGKIDLIDGPFILGMDASPQYDRENSVLHESVLREDLEEIRSFVAHAAAERIEAARPRRRIDVVGGLARVVPIRLVASYFGMPGPNDPTMMRWMRDVFHYIFADLTNASSVRQDALNSSAELHRHMDAQIALRMSMRADSGQNDDVLGRLLSLRDAGHPWLDDNAVRRNLGGVIVGAVDTTSKFVTLAIDELLRRPKSLGEARDAALNGNIDMVWRYACEAVRFNPHHPLQVRFCRRETQIAAKLRRAKNIPAGTFTYVATLSAMFDPAVFTHPEEFNAQRETEYLHFGFGMHACFGRHINAVQIPELLAALLRLPNLRRAPGSAGRILYDGPFPDRLVLEFDA